MGADVDEDLVRDLAGPRVADFSPAEDGELFSLLSEAHFAAPEEYARADAKASPLAFGLPELTVLMTPVLLAAITQVVAYIGQTAVVNGYRVTARAIRRLFGVPAGSSASDDDVVALTSEQWARVRGDRGRRGQPRRRRGGSSGGHRRRGGGTRPARRAMTVLTLGQRAGRRVELV